MEKPNKKVSFFIKAILIILAIKWLLESLKKKKQETVLPQVSYASPVISYNKSTPTYIKTANIEIEELGQTEFTVSGFTPDANLVDFDLLLNTVELINSSVDEENADFTIENLGSGNYKITFVSETITLDPETHTLILKLR